MFIKLNYFYILDYYYNNTGEPLTLKVLLILITQIYLKTLYYCNIISLCFVDTIMSLINFNNISTFWHNLVFHIYSFKTKGFLHIINLVFKEILNYEEKFDHNFSNLELILIFVCK